MINLQLRVSWSQSRHYIFDDFRTVWKLESQAMEEDPSLFFGDSDDPEPDFGVFLGGQDDVQRMDLAELV